MKNTFLLSFLVFFSIGCQAVDQQVTKSGISATHAKNQLDVRPNSKGNSLEQQNILDSYEIENRPGAVKHLYIISPYTGKVILYSTVKGKVTDNAKTLQPSKVASGYAIAFDNRGYTDRTLEVMQESGTYGTSSPYIYWWDVKGVYHKQWLLGGVFIHVSDKPMPIRDGTIKIELN